MDFFTLSNEDLKILPTTLTVISSLLILYVTLIITERFKNKVSRKRKEMYIKFLRRYNEIINKCILDFENLNLSKSKLIKKDVWQIISMVLGIILGFFLTYFVFIICINVLKFDVWRSMAYSALVNILSYLLLITLIRYIKSEERKLLDKIDRIECWFKGIKFFIICSNLLIILFIYMSVSLINYSKIPVSTSEIEEIRNIYGISLAAIVITVIFLNVEHKEFLDKIKSHLNIQCLKDFPFIHIITKDGEFTGKIQDVFDEDLVILDNNGLKWVVEWNTITTLGLKK